jgi:dihydropyrimidinase/allantoinase
MMIDLLLKNGMVYIDGFFEKTDVGIKDEKIVLIGSSEIMPQAQKEVDLQGQYLIPGTIDTHMHVRDPGHTERGNFYTETLAAAAGGVTTIMEHPISVPPQYNVEILENRINRADTQCVVDYCFYGAAGADFPEEITKLAEDGRIIAFKSFLHAAPEGREKEFKGLTMADDAQLLNGMKEITKTGLICAFHAENNDVIKEAIQVFRTEGKTSAIYHALSRPPFTEYQSVQRVLSFAKETGARVEIAHVSTPQSMEMLKQAKQEGMDVYVETCPHYLFLTEDDLVQYGAFAKCNPPLRSKALSVKLWDYINDGTVDYIGSDHSPFLLSEKTCGEEDIFKAASGFPGVDLRLPLMLDAVQDGKVKLERVVELLAVRPAKIFNIFPQKGTIRIGADADFAAFNFDHTMTVDKQNNYSHAKNIAVPYNGRKLKCQLTYTIVRGRILMEQGKVDETAKAYGKLVVPPHQ